MDGGVALHVIMAVCRSWRKLQASAKLSLVARQSANSGSILSRGQNSGSILSRGQGTISAAVPQVSQPLPERCSAPPKTETRNGGINEEFLESRPGMRAKILDGKKLASAIHSEIAAEVKDMVAAGKREPHLVAVLVGDDPASNTYVTSKTKTAEKCGIKGTTIRKPSTMSQADLLDLVRSLNMDEDVDGILIQLPLPEHIDEKDVCNAVSIEKDVDGFHIVNVGRYCLGDPFLIPATPLGVLEIIKRCNIPTYGKNVCIANRSKNIGFTLHTLLHSDGTGDATSIMCHRYTPAEQLPVMTSLADIVIVGAGIPALIKGHMIKDGAAVIDIGINRVPTAKGKTKLVGDAEFESVAQKASIVTPVPGGVGPMTVAMVIRNTLYAAKKDFRFDFRTIYE